MKTIAPAFVKAKKAFGPALKDKTNPAFRSKYADLGACLEAVEGALLDNGIALYQETFEDATGVTVETVFLHESGEMIRCGKLHVPAAKQDPQGYGSALTYARRYSLMAACGIAPEDDDGNAAQRQPANPVQQEQKPSKAFNVSEACSYITKAENRAKAEHYADAAFERARTDAEKKQISDAGAAIPSARPFAAVVLLALMLSTGLYLFKIFDSQNRTLMVFGQTLQLGENENEGSETEK